MSARVDMQGALRIAVAAAEFDWTWSVGDITRFGASLGWGEPGLDEEDPSTVLMTTDLNHGDPVAMFRLDEVGEILLGVVLLADLPLRRPAAALRDIVAFMLPHWGPPTSPASDDGSGAAWVLPGVVLKLDGGKTIELVLQNPARWRAPQQEQSRDSRVHADEGDRFFAHLPTVLGSNLGENLAAEQGRSKLRNALRAFGRRAAPGTWSRRDIDGIFESFGARPDDMGDGSLMADHDDRVALIAAKTLRRQARYGYGRFCELRLLEFVSPETADSGYLRALRLCVERLGDPHMVGGPNAFALWRFDEDTIKLTRMQNTESRLSVSVKPTEPAETELHENPHFDPEIEPEDLWRVVPDPQYSGPALGGVLFSSGEDAEDWGELYQMLCAVFGSLAADIPLLYPYTSDIAWSVMTSDESGFLARGQFSPDGCMIETTIHGRTQQHRFPPGRRNGVEIAELTMDAIEAANLNSPEDLRYNAHATQPPRQLMDAHFGMPEADDNPDLHPSLRPPPEARAYIKSETTYELIDGELHETSRTDYDPPRRAR